MGPSIEGPNTGGIKLEYDKAWKLEARRKTKD